MRFQWLLVHRLTQHLPVSRHSWHCMRLCYCPSAGWCARKGKSSRAPQWSDCLTGGCKNRTLWIQRFMKDVSQNFIPCTTLPRAIEATVSFISFPTVLDFPSPEDILPDSWETRDVLIVDDISVQGWLRHQVGSGQRRVHQGVTLQSQTHV